ncbi:MAG TPA: amidohydrolase family protein [Planctomycetota bacterium]|mgnify:CR=1 FL=1|nr:amidohydrolase family protein [Planctomycetota bacterium]HRR80083.1 amidohydrolase family protein [Planctomycetota bacterium]HRT93769.1 amidohydrolase family protein [Planctomycetota bacterium]
MGKLGRILVRGGTVIDGTGAPARRADVLVEGGRIAAVGGCGQGADGEVLEATGLAVAPGFHDIHTHFDLSLVAEPAHLDGLRQGITTYHVGQCGLGFAPASPGTQALFRDYLAGITGDPALPPFRTVADYLALLRGSAAHVVAILPHGLLRAEVAGMRRGPLSSRQLDRMKALAAEGMEQGARGLSTGLTYFPGSEADIEELVAVAEVVAARGGVYVTHLRNYTDQFLDAIDEACEIGRRAGLPVQISHLRPQGRFRNRAGDVLTHIESWRARGVDVAFDMYTYLKGYTLMSALFLAPEVYAGGIEAALSLLGEPAERRRLRDAAPAADWSEVHIASVWSEANRRFEGLRLPAFAEAVGKDVFDACVDLLVEERLRVGVVGWPIEESDLREVLRHPLCLVGSDSIPMGGARHPRASGCFARYLGHYVRDLGLLPLEEAIRRITSVPARRYGLDGRGVIAEGMAADLVVFDPTAIRDRATYDQPLLLAEGVHHVLLSGRLVLRDGELV